MTLASMRENGVRPLSVTWELCHHDALMGVDAFRRCDAGSCVRPAHGLHLLLGRRCICVAEFRSAGRETLFWGISFQITDRKSNRHGVFLDEAKVGFKAENAAWRERQNGQDCRPNQCKNKKESTTKRTLLTLDKFVPLKAATCNALLSHQSRLLVSFAGTSSLSFQKINQRFARRSG
jgi:hypothetical protein